MGQDNVIEQQRVALKAAAEVRMLEIQQMLRDLEEMASRADMEDQRTLCWAQRMIRQLAGWS